MLKNISQTLIPEFLKKNFGKELFENLDQNQHISVKGFAGSVPSILVAELFLTQKKDVLFIIDDKESAHYITSELEEMIGEENVLYFPETHLEPYQVEKTQNANIVLRTEVLNRLNFDKKKKIIVATASSLSEKVLKKEDFKAISHTIKVGDQLDFDFTEELLNQFNFNYTDFVSEPGEFSVRGGIVDVFSYAYEKPFRITFFGNEVESIKEFDIETQLSTGKVNDFELVSNMNFAVSGSKVSLLDLLPKDSFIVTKNAYLTVKKLKDFYEKAEQKFETLSKEIKHQKPEELFVSDEIFLEDFQKFKTIDFTSQSLQLYDSTILQLNQTSQPSFHKNFELLAEDLKEKKAEGYETWISFSSEKQKERLEEIFASFQQEEENQKLQEENDAVKKQLQDEEEKFAEEVKKNKKLKDDLEASQKALAKLQRQKIQFDEICVKLLECAEVVDKMSQEDNDE